MSLNMPLQSLSRFFIVVGLLLVILTSGSALFTFINYLSSSQLLQHQQHISTQLTHLSNRLYEIETELTRLTHLANPRYDRLTWLLNDFFKSVERAQSLVEIHAPDPVLTAQLQRLEKLIAEKRPLIDHAQRQHSLVTTSYALIPTLTSQCSFDAHSPWPPFIYQVLQSILLAHNTPDLLNSLITQTEQLAPTLPDLPACTQLVQHLRTFLYSFAALLIDKRQLNLSPITQLQEEIQHRFDQQLQTAIQQAAHIRTLMGGLLLLALLVILIFIWLLLRQIRLLRQQSQALSKHNRFYRALNRINHLLIQTTDESALLQKTCDILVRELDVAGSAIFQQRTPDEAPLKLVALSLRQQTDKQAIIKILPPLQLNAEYMSFTHRAWQTGEICHLQAPWKDEHFIPWLPLFNRLHIQSLVIVPLQIHQQTVALLYLYHTERDGFDVTTLKILEKIQLDLSLALERLQLLKTQQSQQIMLQLAEVAFNAHEGMAIATADARLLRTNPALQTLSGHTEDDLEGCPLSQLLLPVETVQEVLNSLPEKKTWQGELTLRHKQGKQLPVRVSLTWVQMELSQVLPELQDTLPDTYIVIQILDLSQLHALEKKLEQSQHTDPVTGLPNRQALLLNLQQVLKHIMPEESWGVLSIINIRHFKAVNDSLGHKGGDTLLKEIGQRLHEQLDFPHLTGRDGNDEFVILPLQFFPNREAAQNAWQSLFSKIESLLMQPVTIDDYQIQIEIYAGTTFFTPKQTPDAETLLNQAERAVRQAKTSQTLQQYYYDSDSNTKAQKLITLRHQLEQALHKQELILFYQPIYSVAEDDIPLAEALIRWQRGDKLIAPGDFIPVLEQSPQLMVRVGHWIIEQAVTQCSQVSQALGRPFQVSINLSAIQFNDPKLTQVLEMAIRSKGLQPSQITLEITETILASNLEQAITTLTTLKSLGFQVAIDDFGTGYSSLQYLQRFSANKIKLDKTFVDPLDAQDPASKAIPEATIAMAHALGAQVITEGVETEAQRALLQRMGCDMIQGYLIAKPMPLDKLIEWLKARSDA